MSTIRRVVYLHTAGPYPGLRQIVAVAEPGVLTFLLTGERKTLEDGPLPDRLVATTMWPDRRRSKALRLKSTDRYVLYRESPVEAAQEPPACP